MSRVPRAPWLALALAALLAGLWAGLVRIGWAWPVPMGLPTVHGPLMVCGFLGTVIALERAVALGRAWGYASPLFAALGALALLAGAARLGAASMVAASVGMALVYGVVLRVQPTLHHALMATGALCWVGGNLLWSLGRPIYAEVLPWMAFLVLTIAGERLELGRMLSPTRTVRGLLIASAGVILAGVVLSTGWQAVGFRVAGAGMVGLAAWLLRFDIARKTVRMKGLPRYAAACLLSGYLWLAIGGALALIYGNPVAGPRYDAVLHAVFVGFVFSMIFGHAPIIVPAVAKVRLGYNSRFYLHAALLHLSLALRLLGDLAGMHRARMLGGLGNAAAVLLFIASSAIAVRRRAAPTRGAIPEGARTP